MGNRQTFQLSQKAQDAIAQVNAIRLQAATNGVNVSPVTASFDDRLKPQQP